MHRRESRCHFHGTHDIFFRNRPHRYDQGTVEASRRYTGNIRPEHRHVAMFFNLPHGNAVLHQRKFKRKAASQDKGDEIVLPYILKVCHLRLQLAIAVDAILRYIGAQVSIRCGDLRHGRAWLRDIEHGARFGVALAEKQEIKSQFLVHNSQIGLRVAFSNARGRLQPFVLPKQCPRLRRRELCHRLIGLCRILDRRHFCHLLFPSNIKGAYAAPWESFMLLCFMRTIWADC